LGPSYVGVTQIPGTATDDEIRTLDAAGVRAVRFNVCRGGSADLAALERFANRVHDLAGWHCELYIDARQLDDIEAVIARLPAVTIDHLGLHADGLPALLRLVGRGARVKATGFGRVDLDPRSTISKIMAVDPTSLVVGTDLPSTRARRAFTPEDFDLVEQTVDVDHVEDVFWNNAAARRSILAWRRPDLDRRQLSGGAAASRCRCSGICKSAPSRPASSTERSTNGRRGYRARR
jgi:Amidohydrolase.